MSAPLPIPTDAAPTPNQNGLLKGATILIGEPLDTAAAATRASLRKEGAQAVLWRRTMKGVKEALQKGGVDLALVDMTLPDGDAILLARQVRFGEFGDNPFLPLMITTWRAETQLITQALAAGADDLLAKPISASQVAKRVNRIALHRKPFVATNDYIGPVRSDMDMPATTRPFEAPNRLKALAFGNSGFDAESQAAFKQAQLRLAAARIENCLRALSASARKALAGAPATLSDSEHRANVLATAAALRETLDAAPEGALRDTAKRLSALADLSTTDHGDAAKAAMLTADIADAVVMIITHRDNADMALPEDIITRIDSRFPNLACA